ncbi:MAG: hypothetical protein QGH45_25225 [Myxococcota bacterium]|jgi:hypothetical protein|nr:hypothetical protein [Myxococcota bacterium]
MRSLYVPLLLCLMGGTSALAGEAPLDLREELRISAAKRLFFEVPGEDTRYLARDIEFWGVGFEEGDLTEAYPPDAWAAFELTGLESGRTRAVAVLELNDNSRDLLAFLEEGDVLTLTLIYRKRREYMWTDVVLDTEETREMIVFQVETLSYALPRIEGYSVLWYDQRAPEQVPPRTHLSQDVLSRISIGVQPGTDIELELAPGAIQTFNFPEMDARVLPLELVTDYKGPIVYGVLSGRMSLAKLAADQVPALDAEGESVVEADLPVDMEGQRLFVLRHQPSITYFLLHVPQEQPGGMKATLKVGEPPPEPEPEPETEAETETETETEAETETETEAETEAEPEAEPGTETE